MYICEDPCSFGLQAKLTRAQSHCPSTQRTLDAQIDFFHVVQCHGGRAIRGPAAGEGAPIGRTDQLGDHTSCCTYIKSLTRLRDDCTTIAWHSAADNASDSGPSWPVADQSSTSDIPKSKASDRYRGRLIWTGMHDDATYQQKLPFKVLLRNREVLSLSRRLASKHTPTDRGSFPLLTRRHRLSLHH